MNQKIIEIFEQLYYLRLNQNEPWRANAYQKAINIIRNLPFEITSSDQVKHLPGFGKSLLEKIDQIISSGTVPELSESILELEPELAFKSEVLKLFESIYGVGPKTAEKWYNRGYRTLEDIPQSETTTNQWYGIVYHEDLIQKIPRAEIDEAHDLLALCLGPKGIYFEILGSYRRGLPESGDIDILVIAQPNRDVLQEIQECGLFTHILSQGQKKMLTIGKIKDLHRRIDVEIVQPEEYIFARTYFVGPGSFNVKMRGHIAELGYRLTEKSLTDTQGNKYYPSSERQLFEWFDLQYLTPEERQNY